MIDETMLDPIDKATELAEEMISEPRARRNWLRVLLIAAGVAIVITIVMRQRAAEQGVVTEPDAFGSTDAAPSLGATGPIATPGA